MPTMTATFTLPIYTAKEWLLASEPHILEYLDEPEAEFAEDTRRAYYWAPLLGFAATPADQRYPAAVWEIVGLRQAVGTLANNTVATSSTDPLPQSLAETYH